MRAVRAADLVYVDAPGSLHRVFDHQSLSGRLSAGAPDVPLQPEAVTVRPSIAAIAGRAWIGIWLAILTVGTIVLTRLGTGTTFFFDEWSWIEYRRGALWSALVRPDNGHLTLIPVAVYRLLFTLGGLTDYSLYRAVGIAAHLVVATLVAVYARKRCGTVVGVSAGAVIIFLGAGWQNIFWPFQIGFMGSLAFGLGAWLLIDRDTRTGDALACACLTASLACSGIGIGIVVGSVVRVALQRSTWARLWIVVPPVFLYGLWYAVYGESQGSISNIPLLGGFVLTAFAGAVGGLAGRPVDAGRFAAGVVAAGVAASCYHLRRIPPALAGIVVAAVANWLLVGYSRASYGNPTASRYVYVGAVFILLITVEVLHAFRPRRLVLAIPLIALLCIWGNSIGLRRAAASFHATSRYVRAELRALEWARSTVDAHYRPDTFRMPQVYAGPYLGAVSAMGSPSDSDSELLQEAESVRAAADRVSLAALRVNLAGAARTPAPSTCRSIVPVHGRPVVVSVPARGATIAATTSPVDVRLKRLADQFPGKVFGTVPARRRQMLVIPPDRGVKPWNASLTSTAPFSLCPPEEGTSN
jgi:hypothetical protein